MNINIGNTNLLATGFNHYGIYNAIARVKAANYLSLHMKIY